MRLGGSGGAAAEEELSGCCKELFKGVGLGWLWRGRRRQAQAGEVGVAAWGFLVKAGP